MTECEWRASTEPLRMLRYLYGRGNDRKLRLFGCACCRQLWHRLGDPRSRSAVEAAERYADGLVGREVLRAAWGASGRAAAVGPACRAAHCVTRARAWAAAADASWHTLLDLGSAGRAGHATLLRDIFGPVPGRPVVIPAGPDPVVVTLARAMYDTCAFDRAPALADALAAAGCDDAAVLAHCRDPAPHARGCWVVDAVLGKGPGRPGDGAQR